MSLIELLVGLVVASLVAAIALANVSMLGLAVARHRIVTRADDAAWMAQAAIARDLRASPYWKGCVEAMGCLTRNTHKGTPVLALADAEWLVDDGLLRCKAVACDRYVDGIVGVAFIVDVVRADGGVSRKPLAKAHGDSAHVLEVVLWTMDGRPYRRATGRHNHVR